MKIILCIFLLYITAVSVFGESQELNGVVGKSIEFPAAVTIEGSWMYRGVTIGVVISGRFETPDKCKDRVQWDSITGFLSLSGLRLEDSGEYTVQNTQRNINTVFQLNVYVGNVPVSKPHLNVTRNEYRCTVLCAAARGTGATLTLYREGEPYVTSPGHSHPDLNVTQTVESGTYTCEAKNSVSSKTSDPLTVGAHCTGSSAGTIAAIIIAVVAVAIVALIAVVFVFLYRRSKTEWRDEQVALQDALKTSIQDEQVALQDALKTSIQGSKTERQDEQAVLLEVVRRTIQDEQAVLLEVFRRTIQDEEVVLLEVFRRTMQEQLQAISPDEQLQAIPPDDTGRKSKVVRRTIQDTKSELEAVRSELKELRGPAKGNEKQKTEKGCAIS